MSKLGDNACLWGKKLNFHFLISLFSGIAPVLPQGFCPFPVLSHFSWGHTARYQNLWMQVIFLAQGSSIKVPLTAKSGVDNSIHRCNTGLRLGANVLWNRSLNAVRRNFNSHWWCFWLCVFREDWVKFLSVLCHLDRIPLTVEFILEFLANEREVEVRKIFDWTLVWNASI